jgi:integrase
MRKSDILNLKWKQIDFEQDALLVKNSKAGGGKSFHLPMSSIVRETLLGLKAESLSPYVFVNPRTVRSMLRLRSRL